MISVNRSCAAGALFCVHMEVVKQGFFSMRSKKHYELPPSFAANGNHINLSAISNDECKCTFTVSRCKYKKQRRKKKEFGAGAHLQSSLGPLVAHVRVRVLEHN